MPRIIVSSGYIALKDLPQDLKILALTVATKACANGKKSHANIVIFTALVVLFQRSFKLERKYNAKELVLEDLAFTEDFLMLEGRAL